MASATKKTFNLASIRENANQIHNEIPPHTPSGWLLSEKQKITNVGENVKQLEPFLPWVEWKLL